MGKLSSIELEFAGNNPRPWEENDIDQIVAIWDIQDNDADQEPIEFDRTVERWFRSLVAYLDKLGRISRNPAYRQLADQVLHGIDVYRGKTKPEAIDIIVAAHQGKTGDIIEDDSGVVWSRRTLCSQLSSWIEIIEALPFN